MEDIYKQTDNLKDKIPFFDLIELAMLHACRIRNAQYNKEELQMIEDEINEMYPEGSYPLSPNLYIPFGWFIGKVVIKNIPGSYWHGDGNDPFNLKIKYPAKEIGEMNFFPLKRIQNFWADRTDGLVPVFEMTQYLHKYGMPDPKDADEDGWINKDGFKMRIKKIDFFE